MIGCDAREGTEWTRRIPGHICSRWVVRAGFWRRSKLNPEGQKDLAVGRDHRGPMGRKGAVLCRGLGQHGLEMDSCLVLTQVFILVTLFWAELCPLNSFTEVPSTSDSDHSQRWAFKEVIKVR